MQINWVHRANQSGKDLIKHFEKIWDSIICNKISMEDTDYFDMFAEKNAADSPKWNVNGIRGTMNSLDESVIRGILESNGITWGVGQGELINRSYQVLVFDLEVLSIKQTIMGKNASPVKYISEQHNEKIATMAKKIVYLLGLDYAMVEIILTGKHKIRVSGIDASPIIRKKQFQTLIEKIEKAMRNRLENRTKEVIMGADPEFMLANSRNGKMIPASNFFPKDGVVGCDNIRIPSRQHRPVAEIRPKPDSSPLELQANIRQALMYAARLAPYKNVKWIAGSQPFSGFSIGGHIHFSNINLNGSLLRALDNYVGIPIFLIENQTSAVKRRKRYGMLADYRTKEYGGFEYRTPGSWLISPEIARSVLCIAKIVSSNYTALSKNIFVRSEAYQAFYNGDQNYFLPFFKELWSDIKALPMYERFQEDLKLIPEMIENNTNWNEDIDIRKAWNIPQKASKNYVESKTGSSKNSSLRMNRQNQPIPSGSSSRTSRASNSSSSSSLSRSTTFGHSLSSTNVPSRSGQSISANRSNSYHTSMSRSQSR